MSTVNSEYWAEAKGRTAASRRSPRRTGTAPGSVAGAPF